jgi:hypothetical protein
MWLSEFQIAFWALRPTSTNKNTRNLTLHGNAVKRWEQIFLGLGTHRLNFHCWHLVVNKFSVHPRLGENKKHKTNAQNKKLLGMYTTTRQSQANAQNKILFPTYTTTLSQANAQNQNWSWNSFLPPTYWENGVSSFFYLPKFFFVVVRCWPQPKFPNLMGKLLLFTRSPLSVVDIFIIN